MIILSRRIFRNLLIFLFFIYFNNFTFSQIPVIPQDTASLRIFIDSLRKTFINSTIFERDLALSNNIISISKKLNFDYGIIRGKLLLAIVYEDAGNYKKALEYYMEVKELSEKINNLKLLSVSYSGIGRIYILTGDYSAALDYLMKGLKIDEAHKDTSGIDANLNNIASIYFYQKMYPQALVYYNKAAELCLVRRDTVNYGKKMNNIGGVYYMLKEYDKALRYFANAYQIAKKTGATNQMLSALNNMANLYNEKGEIDKAIETTERAHSISKEIKDKEKEVLSLNNLTSFYIKKGNFFKALQYAEDFLEIANELSSKSHKVNALSKFSDIYSKLGNYKKAHEYLLQYITVNDSMFNENITHQIAEMQTKYETEKKEKEIEIKNLQIREEQTQVSKQKTQKYAFIGGFAMMLILAVVVFKSYRQKKKDNKLLAQKNVEIEEKNEELNQSNEEIAAQRDEIEAQRDLVTKQKEELELIHSELKDSIYYAERIQKAVLPGEQYIQSKIKGDFFILFKPKDIVSGDFYFIEQRKHWLLIAVADCTGHGVPGAFMSMLGISFLNEIIAKEEIQTASHVLDELRQYVIHSLQQKGVSGEQKDGMDIAFVAINLNPQTSQVSPGAELSKTCEVCTAQYAGANNPLYIVTSPKNQEPSPKNQELPTAAANCQLLEIKGDKMPVAIHENMQPFTNHVIELQKGDTIYLMSDGYADQFGGSKGKKFYEKQLKEMLSVNCNLSMAEQKEILDKTIEGWKNGHNEKYEQTDDITILGIKI